MDVRKPLVLVACIYAFVTIPARIAVAEPRPPQCSIETARARPVASLEPGFRKAFCQNTKSSSCNERWQNGKLFLGYALPDPNIDAVGKIAYMFGTIVAETESNNFSPNTNEKIGPDQKKRGYYPKYIGRGWIQLTWDDKYSKASNAINEQRKRMGLPPNVDALKNPEIVKQPDYAYFILSRAMNDGWIETYRSSVNGARGDKSIELGHFVNKEMVDYDRARAVINANCHFKNGACTPPNELYKVPGAIPVEIYGYIPPSHVLDRSSIAAAAANKMERLLCTG